MSALVITITGNATSIVCNGEIALEPGNVEIAIGRRHDEQGVDIGRDQLDLTAGAGSTPLEPPKALQAAIDPGSVGVEQHPVADGDAKTCSLTREFYDLDAIRMRDLRCVRDARSGRALVANRYRGQPATERKVANRGFVTNPWIP